MNKTYNEVTRKIAQYHKNFRFEPNIHIHMLRTLRATVETMYHQGSIKTDEYIASIREIFGYCINHFSNITTFNILYDKRGA